MESTKPRLDAEVIAALQGADDKHSPPMTIMIGRCLDCARRLPWPSPKAGFWASPVDCPECGRWYYTEAHNNVKPKLQTRPSNSPRELAAQYSPTGMAQVDQSFNAALAADTPPAEGSPARTPAAPARRIERRSDERCELSVVLPAVPLDASLGTPCPTLEVTLVNLSPSGCCLQLSESLTVSYLLLDFGVVGFPGVQALAAVRWVQIEGDSTRVGCEFLFGDHGQTPFARG